MKEGEDKIDNLFKKRLEDPANHLAYNEEDWDAFEQMMDEAKPSRKIFWLPYLSAAAAVLLIFLGWMFFKPSTNTNEIKPDKQTVAVKPAQHPAAQTGTNGGTDQLPEGTPKSSPDNAGGINNVGTQKNAGNSFFTLSAERSRRRYNNSLPGLSGGNKIAPFNNNVAGVQVTPPMQNAQVQAQTPRDTTPPKAAPQMVAQQRDTTPPPATQSIVAGQGQQMVAGTATPDNSVKTPEKPVKKKVTNMGYNRSQFALGVMASSDINGVNSLGNNKVGSNYGMIFSVGVKKLTISTGAVYSVKPYTTSFANYNTGSGYVFPQNPTDVTADCRMLDIPLNVSYQVYKGGRNKVALGTGVSSYFMLHESYKYNYATAYTNNAPASYTVPNPKSYLLSAVNLSATFERQLNSKFSLSVQPYMKVPLKTVGYSQVNLHTAGVAVGFNWNINSFTKP